MIENTSRLSSVDAARWLLCFPVAFLHSISRPDVGSPPLSAVLIAVACRGAVPFFFVASGYFAKPGDLIAPVKRLAPVYLSWLIIYSVVNRRTDQLLHLGVWATGGIAIHLWFIPALIVAQIILPNLVERYGFLIAGLLCLMSASAGLAFDAYRDLLQLPVTGGTRLMMAPLSAYLGIILRRKDISLAPLTSLALFVVAWVAAAGEEATIAYLSHAPIVSHAAVMATFLMGPAIFLCAKTFGQSPSWMGKLGAVSLGVYASHLLFVQIFVFAFGNSGIVLQITIGIAAVIGATILALMLSRYAVTDWLVALRKGRPAG